MSLLLILSVYIAVVLFINYIVLYYASKHELVDLMNSDNKITANMVFIVLFILSWPVTLPIFILYKTAQYLLIRSAELGHKHGGHT